MMEDYVEDLKRIIDKNPWELYEWSNNVLKYATDIWVLKQRHEDLKLDLKKDLDSRSNQ